MLVYSCPFLFQNSSFSFFDEELRAILPVAISQLFMECKYTWKNLKDLRKHLTPDSHILCPFGNLTSWWTCKKKKRKQLIAFHSVSDVLLKFKWQGIVLVLILLLSELLFRRWKWPHDWHRSHHASGELVVVFISA